MTLKGLTVALLTALVPMGLAMEARADTVTAHCDLYAPGEDYAYLSSNCTFSQRQGYVSVQLQSNGHRYEFDPIPNSQPGNFRDQYGNLVYRQSGLGDAGQIFEFVDGSHLWVLWDTSSSYGSAPVQSPSRVATLTAYDRGSQINLRSQATVRSRANGYGLAGDQVNILECVQDTDTPGSDFNWCKVQFLESGAIGWIRSDFIIFPSDGE
ncbi:SH3 domain-containing protein [Nodosilinea sp. LEGE 07088]|uniref:SH3 domain-containing protein n=1 Tax=Nodosilinea sp. LEGE 07088 TaxID=2777968 RepID=UPI0018823AEF|nr:SH3 domain-containing protein [Nodosilinea sp. LEGE 07088]MBE9140232.1 SH3 domain-containing protein [Nodosilinea sp. LEGE 07088]